jgi:voltage-gated potassium channel
MRLFRQAGQVGRGRQLEGALLFVALLAYATSGYMYFELPSKPSLTWLDALWWAVVTMTTVGYGDYFPETLGGRLLVGIPTMFIGIGLLGYLLSLFASLVMESKMKTLKGLARVDVDDHIIICRYNGLGPTLQLIREIRADAHTRDVPIVLVDSHLEEVPPDLQAARVHFVRGEPSREATLEMANFLRARCVLIQLDGRDPERSDDRNLKVALTFERLHPDVTSIVHCHDPENVLFFERANCDSVICTQALSSQMMVQEMQDPGVHAVVAELTTNVHGKQCYLTPPPSGASTFGALKGLYADVVVLGLRRAGHNLLAPTDATPLQPGDQVVVVAGNRPRT